MWAILTLISTLFEGGSFIVEKKALVREHAMEFAAASAIVTMVLTAPLWAFADTSSLSLEAVGWIFLAALTSCLGILFLAKAMRHMAVSYTTPFLAAGPIFTVILAAIIYGESITWLQLLGVLVIISGAYILNSHKHENLFAPFTHLVKLPHMKYVLLTLLAYAAGGILDKKVVGSGQLHIGLLTYFPLLFFFMGIIFILFMILFHDGLDGIARGLRKNSLYLGLFAALALGMKVFVIWAISIPGALLSLIIPLKKLSSLFSTIIGGKLLKEDHLMRKSVACIIMIFGAVLILI